MLVYPKEGEYRMSDDLVSGIIDIYKWYGYEGRRAYFWTACTILKGVFNFLLFYATYHFLGDYKTLILLIPNYPFKIMSFLKLTYLHMNKKRIKYMLDVIKHEFWDFKVGGPEAQTKIRKNCSLIVSLFRATLVGGIVSVLPIAAFPLVRLPGKRPLPYVILVPFDTDLSPLYQILYALMIWDIVMSVLGSAFDDAIYCYTTQQLSVQLELLKDLIRNISEGIMDECSDLDRFDSKYFQKEVMKRLKICAQHHWKLLRFGNDVEHFYRLMLTAQLFMTFFLLVLNGYVLMSATTISKLIMLPCVISILCLVQVTFYTLLATQLKEQSLSVLNAIIECKWYLFRAPIKKALVYMLMNTEQRCISLTAAGIVEIYNPLLITILQKAFSVITLLQALTDDAN